MTSPNTLARRPSPQASLGIYWLASYPRSGNTWLRCFHYALNEVIAGRSGKVDINRLEECSISEAWFRHFSPFLPPGTGAEVWSKVSAARPRAQAALAANARGVLFVKTHLAVLNIGGVPTINNDVTRGATYLVRNPLDVACSLAPHMGWSLDQAIKVMGSVGYSLTNPGVAHEPTSSWSQNVESWTRIPQPSVNVMRYEDMVADPQTAFARFARHAGIKASPAQVRRAVAAAQFQALRRKEEAEGMHLKSSLATDNFFRVGRSGGWREVLSKDQVERIVTAHRAQMARFGYLDDL